MYMIANRRFISLWEILFLLPLFPGTPSDSSGKRLLLEFIINNQQQTRKEFIISTQKDFTLNIVHKIDLSRSCRKFHLSSGHQLSLIAANILIQAKLNIWNV